MVGMFTGEVLEITALMFEIFDAGGSLGSVSGAQALTGGFSFAFNFKFDLILGAFLDGESTNGDGLFWNFAGPGVGFQILSKINCDCECGN